MGGLVEQAFTVEKLRQAWDDVLENDGEDGTLSSGTVLFLEDVDDNLAQLAAVLADGSYVPGELTPVTIVTGQKSRELHIPRVRDRIVARALMTAVTPLVDPHLGSCSYAYRPGLGVQDAIQAVVGLREEGLDWVLRTDVKDCFPNLPKGHAVVRFNELVADGPIRSIVADLVNRTYRLPTGGIRQLAGVPQGCPLSPLLANLVLAELDRALMIEGFPVVRYADDLVVVTDSPGAVDEAARITRETLHGLGMAMNEDKTKSTSFHEGFTFLGEDFGPRYPPVLDDHRVHEPPSRVLYVGHQGSRARISAGRIKVESGKNEELLDVASAQVSRIVCFGSVGMSAGLRSWALFNDVDVVFASRKGNYLGTMLAHTDRTRPARLRAQIAACESPHALTLAKRIVHAKITNQRTLLERYNRRRHRDDAAEAIRALTFLRSMIADAGDVMEVMGLEGAAARSFFPCLGAMVPEELRFAERSRQPPLDLFNAAVSYLYTILLGECVTALHAAGLDPAFGVLHTEQKTRPSLALDLMEEFRPWLVDQVVLEAVMRNRLTAVHGRKEKNAGVMLTKEGKTIIVDAYEKRMLGTVRGALPGFSGTRRRHIYRQAQRLCATMMNPQVEWTGLSWRP